MEVWPIAMHLLNIFFTTIIQNIVKCFFSLLNLQLAMKLDPQMTSNFSIKLVNSRQDMK